MPPDLVLDQVSDGFGLPQQMSQPGGPLYQPQYQQQQVPTFQQPKPRGHPSPLMQPQQPRQMTHQFSQPSQPHRRRSNPVDFHLRHPLSSPQLGALSTSKLVPDMPSESSNSLSRSSMRSSDGALQGDGLGVPTLQDASIVTDVMVREQQSLTVQPQSYSVIQEIGSGGAGKAYLVRGKDDGKTYISKQIICLGDQYRAAPASYALHETRLMFLLRHPHIVELLDFFPKSSTFSIIMEYCQQGDLSQHIELAIRQGNTRFDADRVYTWWYQILDAIDYCHAKGIIHRDLKPKNIFLDAQMNVKIGDFGVSALISFPPAAERVGTTTYHAPEVQASLHYSPQSDIWSIGCILWEAMVLRPSGGEPITLQQINLFSIAQMYGNAARNLLVHQLQPDSDQRPPAAFLKQTLMKELATGLRERVAATAAASGAAAQSSSERQRQWMTPKQVPETLLPRPGPAADHAQTPGTHLPNATPAHHGSTRGNASPSGFNTSQFETPVVPDLRSQSAEQPAASDLKVTLFPPETRAPPPPSRSPARERERDELSEPPRSLPTDIASKPTIVTAESVQPSPAPSLSSAAQPPPEPDAEQLSKGRPVVASGSGSSGGRGAGGNDLGISLSAGEGGEYGAWKIAKLDAEKGVGRAGEVQVGEFLWEINKKVIFGMPLTAIMGLLRGKPGGKVTLGLKAGLGLPIRHVTLNSDGSVASSPHLSAEAPSPAIAPMENTNSAKAPETVAVAGTDARTNHKQPSDLTSTGGGAEEPASMESSIGNSSSGRKQEAESTAELDPKEGDKPPIQTRTSTAFTDEGRGPPPAAAPASPEAAKTVESVHEQSPPVPKEGEASPEMSPEMVTPRPQESPAVVTAPEAIDEHPPAAESTKPELAAPSRQPQSSTALLDSSAELQSKAATVQDADEVPDRRQSPATASDSQESSSRAVASPKVLPSKAPRVASSFSPRLEGPATTQQSDGAERQATVIRASPMTTFDVNRSQFSALESSQPNPAPASPYSSPPDVQPASDGTPTAPGEWRARPYVREPEPQASLARSSPLMGGVRHSETSAGPPAAPDSARSQKNETSSPGSSDSAAYSRVGSAPRPQVAGSAQIAGDGQYTGELREGRPYGKGTATWPNQGHTYVGEWRNGVMHGQGTATYLNGDRYDGEWSNGKRSGLGRYAHGSGDVFEGLWANERKDYLGVDTFADGRGYRGEFKENKFAGVGTYFTADGAMYQGDWYQGKAHGFGISTSASGGQPAFVQYSHGNLTQSELMGKNEHIEMKERVERRSIAAVHSALRARRIAASIQGIGLQTSSNVMRGLEREVGAVMPSNDTSLLGKVVNMLIGVDTAMHDDSTLVVTSFDDADDIGRMPLAIGDTIVEVSERSCSWYQGMSLEEILVHLQSAQTFWLQLGVRSRGSPDWSRIRVVQVSKREAGFVV